MSTRATRVLAAGLLCVGLSGCIVVSDTSNSSRSPTTGQELRDLKVARDEGALDDEQYQDARHKLLARLDKPPGK
jgi:hypothetical protein